MFKSIFLTFCLSINALTASAPTDTTSQSALSAGDPIVLHFFWTTGIPYEFIADENEPDRHVHIGGSKWSDKFPACVEQFLDSTPSNISIVFVGDRLTFESNAEQFQAFTGRFGNRFQYQPWDTVKSKLEKTFPDFRSGNPQKFLTQATFGNPAITSDIYRLVGMPLINDEPLNAETVHIYSDIDTFVNCLHNPIAAHAQEYRQILLMPESDASVFKVNPRNNDLIKIKAQT